MSTPQFLLVEPVAKTPYPPLGLMKIATMLKHRHPGCSILSQIGNDNIIGNPKAIYITSLFTWDIDKVINSINFYARHFPRASIKVGGIAASLLPELIYSKTGVKPHIGLYKSAEFYPPDYTFNFGRKLRSSITFTSRGCIRKCKFCSVNTLEPQFLVKKNWRKDISDDLPFITFWDNNWLASPNLERDCGKLSDIGKKVDFNQGLDARLYDKTKAKLISKIRIDPIRFAFDHISYEKDVIRAIRLTKEYSGEGNEIRVYVLYNYKDSPEDLFYRLNVLNKERVLIFPMEYRDPKEIKSKFPGTHWDTKLLRAFKLTLLFYYRKGMITESRDSFENMYGRDSHEFKSNLYQIYRNDKDRHKSKSH